MNTGFPIWPMPVVLLSSGDRITIPFDHTVDLTISHQSSLQHSTINRGSRRLELPEKPYYSHDSWLKRRGQVNGAGSFDLDEDDVLSFEWSAASDNPSNVHFDSQSRVITFSPAVEGTYTFTLVVSDGKDSSVPDVVTISVLGLNNSPPIADARPKSPVINSSGFTVDAIASTDPDGDPLTYLWRVDKPGVTIVDSTAVIAVLNFSKSDTYTITLVVSDGVFTATDQISVSANLPGVPPVAVAFDTTGAVGSIITLDASGSTDADGDSLLYSWTSGGVTLSDRTDDMPTFVPDEEGVYFFFLSVSDGVFTTEEILVRVTVTGGSQFQELDGMIEIPAGPFLMGRSTGEGLLGEKPQRSVNVDAYWIDKHEVTAADYDSYVASGPCTAAGENSACNSNKSGREDHPVNCVSWDQAVVFCGSVGKRLPTEAEQSGKRRSEVLMAESFPGRRVGLHQQN